MDTLDVILAKCKGACILDMPQHNNYPEAKEGFGPLIMLGLPYGGKVLYMQGSSNCTMPFICKQCMVKAVMGKVIIVMAVMLWLLGTCSAGP